MFNSASFCLCFLEAEIFHFLSGCRNTEKAPKAVCSSTINKVYIEYYRAKDVQCIEASNYG